MKIRTMKQFFFDSLKGIARNRVMSIASIGTVTATVFIFGAIMMMALNINNMIESVGDQIEIKVYLDKKLKDEDKKAIEPIIKKIPNVTDIKYETKEQALEKMKEQLGEKADLASGLEKNNPLPESYIVRVNSPENIGQVSQSLAKIKGVTEVKDGKSQVDKILHINKVVKTSSMVLMAIFGIVALFLISNTIKLTVYARKKEIGIMKYIGATDWFIRWPFIMEGVILGLVGVIISLILLAFSYKYMSGVINDLLMMFNPVPFGEMIWGLSWKFILLGIGIGGAGSAISLRKFLQV